MLMNYTEIDTLSHQLLTPLTVILGLIQQLKNERLSQTQTGYINDISTAGEELIGALDSLLITRQSTVDLISTLPESGPVDKTSPSPETVAKETALKALLVEDNRIIQTVHRRMLEELGCKVDVAGGGNEALTLLKEQHYSVVLMDIGLPDISGIEVIKTFRQYNQTTRIIVVTAYVSDEIKKSCLESGCNMLLNKPVAMNILRDYLSDLKNPEP